MDPPIKAWPDLHSLAEEFNKNEHNFLSTTFSYVDADDRAYFGQINKPKFEISLEEVSAALQPIEDDQIYPELKPDLLQAPEHSDSDGPRFIKRPPISNFHDYKEWDAVDVIPETLLQEAYALQEISHSPHPNIVPFYGCRVRRGRITGLVLHSYESHLREKLREGGIDEKKILEGLESALRHLHSLGWAHNDVNPTNVMVNETGEPILVDFGSCRKIGDKMGASRGTSGWAEDGDDYTLSKASHDLHGLEKIRSWLESTKST